MVSSFKKAKIKGVYHIYITGETQVENDTPGKIFTLSRWRNVHT